MPHIQDPEELQELLEEFQKRTHLGPTEIGRLAADPDSGKPMSPNTVRTVLNGESFSEETERRLRRAIRDFIEDISAFVGEHEAVIDLDAEEEEVVERVTARRRKRE